MKGYNCEQLRMMKLQTILKIVETEGLIEFTELYSRMAVQFGITKTKMEEYLQVLEDAKKVVLTKTFNKNKPIILTIKSVKL